MIELITMIFGYFIFTGLFLATIKFIFIIGKLVEDAWNIMTGGVRK